MASIIPKPLFSRLLSAKIFRLMHFYIKTIALNFYISRCTFFRYVVIAIQISILHVSTPVLANESKIAVVYPDLPISYPNIFSQIISSVENHSGQNSIGYALVKNYNIDELNTWLEHKNPHTIIVLGNRAMSAVKKIDSSVPTVTSAVLRVPKEFDGKNPVISLAPDPNLIFLRLKEITQDISRVMVVFNPKQNNWLVAKAKKAASKHGLTLDAHSAANLREVVNLYRKLINSSDTQHDALWILQDRITGSSKNILPQILKDSWKRKLVVFSSNPSHAKRGVLFSFYPDNIALGTRLAKLALDQLTNKSKKVMGTEPLRDLLWAVNVRTARHLGLDISMSLERKFDLVFPND